MAKFTPKQKLDKTIRQKALLELCHAIVIVKKLPEAARVLGDLLSEQEVDMVAKRLQIAKLLLQQKTYADIRKALKVSQPTIARVNLWLQQGGAGYRMVVAGQGKEFKIPDERPVAYTPDEFYSWSYIKRKLPLYFWPQILLEEIVKSASARQRKKILDTLKILRKSGQEKKQAFRCLEGILQKQINTLDTKVT